VAHRSLEAFDNLLERLVDRQPNVFHREPRIAHRIVSWALASKKYSGVSVVGDDGQARRKFLGLAGGMPFRFLDAGRLRNARTVERMTLWSGELGQRLGYFPRMNYWLLGEPWSGGREDRVKELIASR
jgi:hypothetical protein